MIYILWELFFDSFWATQICVCKDDLQVFFFFLTKYMHYFSTNKNLVRNKKMYCITLVGTLSRSKINEHEGVVREGPWRTLSDFSSIDQFSLQTLISIDLQSLGSTQIQQLSFILFPTSKPLLSLLFLTSLFFFHISICSNYTNAIKSSVVNYFQRWPPAILPIPVHTC